MIEKIKTLLEKYQAEQDEIDDLCGDYVDAYDASGGNFDNAYQLGFEHGEVYGKLSILEDLLKSN